MFTGLVEAVGRVAASRSDGPGIHLRIETPLANELAAGDSLAVNGVCLTATRAEDGVVEADLGPETIGVTTLGLLRAGQLVNLERPMKADGRLGGHFVLGHVDGVGRVEELRREGETWWLGVSIPEPLERYVISKGSIVVDGISLTLAAGEIRTLIGPNGAGKTTLFHLLSGLLRPDAGTVRLRGEDITALLPHRIWRQGLSRTFQLPEIFPNLSVLENVQVALLSAAGQTWRLWRGTAPRWRQQGAQVLEGMSLASQREHLAGTLP